MKDHNTWRLKEIVVFSVMAAMSGPYRQDWI